MGNIRTMINNTVLHTENLLSKLNVSALITHITETVSVLIT
jgi:ABC-type polysaccharide/polyol phosphate export permease